MHTSTHYKQHKTTTPVPTQLSLSSLNGAIQLTNTTSPFNTHTHTHTHTKKFSKTHSEKSGARVEDRERKSEAVQLSASPSAPQIQCQCVYVSFVWSPTPNRLLLSQLQADRQVSPQPIYVQNTTPPSSLFSTHDTHTHTHTQTQTHFSTCTHSTQTQQAGADDKLRAAFPRHGRRWKEIVKREVGERKKGRAAAGVFSVYNKQRNVMTTMVHRSQRMKTHTRHKRHNDIWTLTHQLKSLEHEKCVKTKEEGVFISLPHCHLNALPFCPAAQ